ncbi:MAG: UbiA family prenyltransferase [bacterium]
MSSNNGILQDKPANRREVFHGFLELIRLPNLLTVPGDILAGFTLAGVSPGNLPCIVPVLLISLFLYTCGLILNDYVDRETDRAERPGRPIPSGRVQPGTALTIALVLLVLAIFLSLITGRENVPLIGCAASSFHPGFSLIGITGGLAALILLYNCCVRTIPLAGFGVMGLCRGANLLLGASIGARPFTAAVFIGAGLEASYIAAVSAIAHQETRGGTVHGARRFLPLAPVIALASLGMFSRFSFLKMGVILFTAGWTWHTLWFGSWNGRSIPTKVGQLIRNIILIQSGLLVLTMDRSPEQSHFILIALPFLMLFFIFSLWAGQRFYGS